MNEIKPIIDSIQHQSDLECEKILKETKDKILEIKKESESLINKKIESMMKERGKKINLVLEKGKSSIESFKKKEILKAKNKLIEELIEKAKARIIHKNPKEYFLLILQLINRFKLDKKGEVVFSKKDLGRMPESFKEEVSRISEGKLTVSNIPLGINYGFVLVYNKMEENCSIDAIFSDNYEEFQDIANKNLFKA